MTCICCFFDNKTQNKLKKQSYNKSDFITTMINYKSLYLEGINNISKISLCNCKYSKQYSTNKVFAQFCNDMEIDLKTKISFINELFNKLINVYNLYKNGQVENAYRKMNEYFLYCTNYSSNNAMQSCNILFRGRRKGNYDNDKISEFFHIPFNKKELVNSQRFSIKGKPILYLARSVTTAIKELNTDTSDTDFAVYYPIYSKFYRQGLYNITNSIEQSIYSIYMSIITGSIIEYDNRTYAFSKNNSNVILGDSILFQLLTMPVMDRTSQPDEYILPQMFTTFLEKRGYVGLIYQSTKDIDEFGDKFKEEKLDYNYCYFVKEDRDCEYDTSLLDKFYYECIGNCKKNISYSIVDSQVEECQSILRKQSETFILDEYGSLINKVATYVKNMRTLYNEISEADLENGTLKIELSLVSGLLNKVRTVLLDPAVHGVISISELKNM